MAGLEYDAFDQLADEARKALHGQLPEDQRVVAVKLLIRLSGIMQGMIEQGHSGEVLIHFTGGRLDLATLDIRGGGTLIDIIRNAPVEPA